MIGVRQLRVSTWRFTKQSLPVVLDLVGFAAITVGIWMLFGAWAWLAAGGLLILGGYRAQS
jgi:hypothetical protein